MEIPEDKLRAIREAIYAGTSRKIEAIKLVREATGCGLKEAKDFVEKTAAERYAKEPQRFSVPPGGKGCVGVVLAGTMLVACVVVAFKVLI